MKKSQKARQAQAQQATRAARQHLTALLGFHAKQHDNLLSIAEQVLETGKYSPEEALSDYISLTLNCVGALANCLLGDPKVASSDFDQISEVSGPNVVSSLGAPVNRIRKEPSVGFHGPSGASVRPQEVVIRRLLDGSLHVVLMNLPSALPDGDYLGEVQSRLTVTPRVIEKVTATKLTRGRKPQTLGFGAQVPAQLLSDKLLDLTQKLFQ